MYGVIEQLFEDLNSYYESFVAVPDAPHTKYVTTGVEQTPQSRRQFPSTNFFVDMARKASNTSNSSSPRALAEWQSTSRHSRNKRSAGSTKDLPPLSLEEATVQTESSPKSKASCPPVRQASTEIVTSPLSPSSAGAITSPRATEANNSPRKESTGSTSGSTRPDMNRAKTVAAVGVNGTTVSAVSLANVGDTSASPSRKVSVGSEVPKNEAPLIRSHSNDTILARQASTLVGSHSENIARELSESIMSLRTVDGSSAPRNHDTKASVGAVAPAPMLAPGKREPPHGLGRTVRDAINLKLFPTHTNPPEVHDWDVPVSLLDLSRRISDNWDLTMIKIIPFVNGVNHVKRIAQLADADLELSRQCIEHLLYYRCVIIIDTFQFSNIYTVRPTIATLAEDEIVINECAPYVTCHGYEMPSWPKLLKLYSSLRPSLTLNEWIEDNHIDEIGIDVRRFVTFGMIKGFIRRVHRYPILLNGSDFDESLFQRHSSFYSMRDESKSRSRESDRIEQTRNDELPSEATYPEIPKLNRRYASDGDAQKSEFHDIPASHSRDSPGPGTLKTAHNTGSGGRRRFGVQLVQGQQHQHRKTRATAMNVANFAFDTARELANAEEKRWGPSSQLSRGRLASRTPIVRSGSNSTLKLPHVPARDSDGSMGPAAGRATSEGANTIHIPPGFLDMLDGTNPDDAFCVQFGKSWNEVLHILMYLGHQPPASQRSTAPYKAPHGRGNTDAADSSAFESSGYGEAPDDSAFYQLSGIWNTSSLIGIRKQDTSSASGISGQQPLNPSVTFPSLPRYRQGSSQNTGFNRYTGPDGSSTQVSSGFTPWSRSGGNISGVFGLEDFSYDDRQRLARGDIGRIQLIVK